MSRYKAKWKPYQVNKDFWREVFVGRTITEVHWHKVEEADKLKTRLNGFTLDDGTEVSISLKGILSIRDDEDVPVLKRG